ncbi:uncharacterized protein EI97DRAFT_197193 [Westerdykella ornata]|uniref:Zn(2)-C6 fungal-type domain-containing protein n=1 Tax=Westerdykella ornata TaxID=318751 RepID=A0A6A6J8F2_WESOR|nr:uncharacterized protein EI97DRAFT_197193 [Westerdykella ornata]KAF2272830.1 hypothetical protein EI97DRAFT_197193 [Westerdykella ornata]
MASSQSQRPGLPSPSASRDGSAPLPDRPKLRNSCHACASSKLKCSQEKPTCSRCAKRNLTCEYVLAKRGGRKPGSRSNTTETRNSDRSSATPVLGRTEAVNLPSQANPLAPSPSSQNTDALHLPGLMHSSTEASGVVDSDRLRGFFSPMDQTLSTASTSVEPDLNDFFVSPLSFPADFSDSLLFRTGDLFSTGMSSGSTSSGSEALSAAFPGFEDAVSDLFSPFVPSSTPENWSSPGKERLAYQETFGAGLSCTCLAQALGLMKQLFPPSPARRWSSQDLGRTFSASPTTQAVIAQNETTIEALGAMLSCSCSHDDYLLAVMSLIIFKVLGWYVAVARKAPGLQSSTTGASGSSSPPDPAMPITTMAAFCLDGADSARMTAQLVLNELHRVRRLVDQLSAKLKARASKSETETVESPDLHGDTVLPLSAGMYEQLEVDLRTRLKAVSWEMIDRLRKL